ncbi:MAG: glycerate kinase, partial [Mycobacteriales bacterium]
MRVLVAPDCFGETLTAPAAAAAIARGWRSVAPADSLDLAPVSDGGPGFLDVLAAGLPQARRVAVTVADPLGRPTPAAVLLDSDTDGDRSTAYLEVA